MIWVCRCGKNSTYYQYYIETERIYLAWEGYKMDLGNYDSLTDFRKVVTEEKGSVSTTSTSNWAGQLNAFCNEMKCGDYVLIPSYKSRYYLWAKITGKYEYHQMNEKELYHSRKISILHSNIPRDIFSRNLQYTLGAFRTIFRVKNEKEVFDTISKFA